MIKLAIVGANGQLGRDICSVFADNAKYAVSQIIREQADLQDIGQITFALEKTGPVDYLINCAALTDTAECERLPEKAQRINAGAVAEMAAWCGLRGSTFLHFSTDYVFDGKKGVPYLEHDQPNPLNVYGKSKLLGEYAVGQLLNRYFIFRVSSLFGPSADYRGRNFVETILAAADTGKELTVVEDQFMTPTYTYDVARTVCALVEQNNRQYGIYHCAAAGFCSWYEFAREILAVSELSVPIRPVSAQLYGSRLQRPVNSALDTEKIKRIFPPRSWREAVREYVEQRIAWR